MTYELKVVDKSGKLIDILKGEDVDELLRRGAKLRLKDFLGYYYEKERMIQNACKNFAQSLSDEIKKRLEQEQKIFPRLDYSLPEITWDLLLNDFYEQNPQPPKDETPILPEFEKIPTEPKIEDPYYQYKFSFKDEIIPFRKKQLVDRLQLEFQKDHLIWEKKRDSIEARNREKDLEYQEKLNSFEDTYAKKLEEWVNKKSSVADRSRTFKEGYQNLKPFAVEKYCELILLNSKIENFNYKRKVSLRYVEETKFLFVEYLLPSISELSSIREISLSSENNKYHEIRFSATELNARYKSVLYQLMFHCLYELFYLDKNNALSEVTFRGTVPNDEAEKKHSLPVLSFSIKKTDFMNLKFDLNVNLADYFKLHGGVYQSESGTFVPRLIPTSSLNR